MSKKKTTETTPPTSPTRQEQPPAKAAAPQRKYRWQGPFHTKGIKIPGIGLIRPIMYTDEQIEEFIKKYPARKAWWSGWND